MTRLRRSTAPDETEVGNECQSCTDGKSYNNYAVLDLRVRVHVYSTVHRYNSLSSYTHVRKYSSNNFLWRMRDTVQHSQPIPIWEIDRLAIFGSTALCSSYSSCQFRQARAGLGIPVFNRLQLRIGNWTFFWVIFQVLECLHQTPAL